MKYHNGAFDTLFDASQRPVLEQRLFLVPDIHNKFDSSAVMLHDGFRKLGYVSATLAPNVKEALDELSALEGKDQVLVVQLPKQENRAEFDWVSSLNVNVIGYVYERIARKLAKEN